MKTPALDGGPAILGDLGISVLKTDVKERASRQKSQSKTETAEYSRKGNRTVCLV